MNLASVQPSTDSNANPYVGPRTFSEAQGKLFFGREREARDLTARCVSERLLLFYAQSGAGKSSLLHTRVIPRLRDEEGFQVLPVGRVAGELPAGVDAVANIFTFNLMVSLDQSEAHPARLAQLTLSEFLARLAGENVVGVDGQRTLRWVYKPDAVIASPAASAPAASARPGPRFALIIDQFEEIITSHPARWSEREDFFRQLDQAMRADPNLWVVLTLREDYVAALDPYAQYMADRLRARFYMERMGVETALQAIRQPAALAGRPFAQNVAEKLVDNLRRIKVVGQQKEQLGEYIEPVQLQVVCYQLWENVKVRALEIIRETDLPAGYIDLSLTDFYNDALKTTLSDPSIQALHRTEGNMKVPEVTDILLRRWFSTELITTGGIRNILLRDGVLGRTGSLPNAAVDRLERLYLVRTEVRAGRYWVELVHDRFVSPILKANELYIVLTSASLASYDVPLMIQKASENILERYPMTPQLYKQKSVAEEVIRCETNQFRQMAYISAKGADWIGARLKDIEMWLVCLLSDLPTRVARLIHTVVSSIGALLTLIPSWAKRRFRGEGVALDAWFIARLKYGALRVMSLLFQIFDLVGMPELFTILWRALTQTKPLTYFEVITLTYLLGPYALRYKDVRVAEGGIVSLVFKLEWFRRQGSFTLFHTINLMKKDNFDFRMLLFELTQVIQYEQVGSIYLMESVIADLTSGYDYGGLEGLRQDRKRGKHYKDYNRLQQAKIVADYFSAVFYGQDASIYLPLINEFRSGEF